MKHIIYKDLEIHEGKPYIRMTIYDDEKDEAKEIKRQIKEEEWTSHNTTI